MHHSSSVFNDYVQSVLDTNFLPNVEYWEARGLDQFLQWRTDFYRARNIEAVDPDIEEEEVAQAHISHVDKSSLSNSSTHLQTLSNCETFAVGMAIIIL
jgi:hypothetical protein